MANLSTASFTSVVVITVALITSILSITVDRWGQYTFNNPTGQVLKIHYGLVNLCTCAFDTCNCVKIADSEEAFRKASLAAVCLAFMANLIALFTMITWILNIGSDSMRKILKIVTISLLGMAVFWNFIAVVVFGAMDKKDSKDAQKAGIDIEDYKLGWAWGMAFLSAMFELIGMIAVARSQKGRE